MHLRICRGKCKGSVVSGYKGLSIQQGTVNCLSTRQNGPQVPGIAGAAANFFG